MSLSQPLWLVWLVAASLTLNVQRLVPAGTRLKPGCATPDAGAHARAAGLLLTEGRVVLASISVALRSRIALD
jgi:hypothetical protein